MWILGLLTHVSFSSTGVVPDDPALSCAPTMSGGFSCMERMHTGTLYASHRSGLAPHELVSNPREPTHTDNRCGQLQSCPEERSKETVLGMWGICADGAPCFSTVFSTAVQLVSKGPAFGDVAGPFFPNQQNRVLQEPWYARRMTCPRSRLTNGHASQLSMVVLDVWGLHRLSFESRFCKPFLPLIGLSAMPGGESDSTSTTSLAIWCKADTHTPMHVYYVRVHSRTCIELN